MSFDSINKKSKNLQLIIVLLFAILCNNMYLQAQTEGLYEGKFYIDTGRKDETVFYQNTINIKIEKSGVVSGKFNIDAGFTNDRDHDQFAGTFQGEMQGTSFNANGTITLLMRNGEPLEADFSLVNVLLSGNFTADGSALQITGRLTLSNKANQGGSQSFPYTAALSDGEEGKDGEDCDCAITIPQDLKPGGSLYVVTQTTGCVMSEVIYYNGKDRQISNWDGNAVAVEVQITCCNHRAFSKKFTVPAYQSDEKVEIVTSEISKGGSLPAPPPGQVAVSTAVALAITTLLQALFAGGGSGSIPIPPLPVSPAKPPVRTGPPPMPPQTPPVRATPPGNRTNASGNKSKPDVTWTSGKRTPEEQKKYDAEIFEKNQQKKKELRERQNRLEADAEQGKRDSGYNPIALAKNLTQTVSISYNEVNDLTYRSFVKYYDVKQQLTDFKAELDRDPQEAKKMIINAAILIENAKKSASEYIADGRMKNDLYDAGKNIINTNKEFAKNLIISPVKTITNYTKTAFGTENWEKSWDMKAPLETRLMNAGIAIAKTCSTIGTLGMAKELTKVLVTKQPLKLMDGLKSGWVALNHQKHLYTPKFEEALPGAINKLKVEGLKATAKIGVDHYLNHPGSKSAPQVEKVNDWLEYLNKGFEKKPA